MLMPTAGERRTLVASTPVVVIGIALVAGLLARSVAAAPVDPRRLRTVRGDVGRAERDHLRRRRRDRVGRRHPHAERRAQLPQRRQGAGLERAAGHAAAADARPHHHARAEEPDQGAGDRLRRRRHGRRGLDRSDGQGPDDCRDRAAGPARRVHPLRRAQLQRRRQPEGQGASRRCAALPADDGREVRRDHVGSARPLGQGRRDALHPRVLRGGEGATSIPAASSRCSCSCTRAARRR